MAGLNIAVVPAPEPGDDEDGLLLEREAEARWAADDLVDSALEDAQIVERILCARCHP